jgi:glutamate synthase domain-containing protein 2
MGPRTSFVTISFISLAAIAAISKLYHPLFWSVMIIVGPLIIVGVVDMIQKTQAIRRNFPLVGHLRYFLEKFRPEIMQYFIESDIEGRPISRVFRDIIYRRAKDVIDTTPFGTQSDVYEVGYEWMDHSIYAKVRGKNNQIPRILIGGPDCSKPYSASMLNTSAMSFGSLSKNAILALNKGAKIDNYAHNTGEGGMSHYHLKHGGDLIWQVGTGYFGCRDEEGNFSPENFKEKATLDQVKMIEIKISQGAKPGHGGILPAIKNTKEIAEIRGVEPHTEVRSPPSHSAFSSPGGLMDFIKKLRDLSGGKPIGFKLCIGKKEEFIEICEAMLDKNITPDFITIDGGEGGTGAAPLEFSNSLGMPLREGLVFAHDTLVGYGLKKDIKLIASGKILTGFHIARTYALGADLCNSARGMMISLGCIQALQCNVNTCPTGVATQNRSLMKGLGVDDKSVRAANYHHHTIHSFLELLSAAGISHPDEIKRVDIKRRVSQNEYKSYEDLFPSPVEGSLLRSKDAIA